LQNKAVLGLKSIFLVSVLIIWRVFLPVILVTAIPEIPGPDDKAKIVIIE